MKKTLFTIAIACACLIAYAQAPIYKCQVNGKTVYSESPCPIGTKKQTMIDTTPEYMGNKTYDRETIEAARSRIRAGMNERGAGVSTGTPLPIGAGAAARNASPSERANICESIKNEAIDLDNWSRRRHHGYSQDRINQRRRELQSISYDWAC